MLLRELLRDPHLTEYGVVIIDEAHERTLRTDMLLCILRQLQLARANGVQNPGNPTDTSHPSPLKLVIMSASLDAESFSQYFDGCVRAGIHPDLTAYGYARATVVYVQGRQHPVEIFYVKEPQPDYVDAALRTFHQIHSQPIPGDVLIFLAGKDSLGYITVPHNQFSGQEDIEALGAAVLQYRCSRPQDEMDVR